MSSLERYTSEVSDYRLPILARVPAGATVLDVGPWTGAHGRHLVQHAGATVDGVETDAEAAAVASADYREVIVGPVDDEAIQARLAGRGYDTILFLDVLEHLRDPA